METMNATMIWMMFQIILTISSAYATACFSYLIDYCIWPGSIFQSWLPWLSKRIIHKRDRQKFNHIMSLPEDARADNFTQAAESYFFYKILGGCIICTNIWVCFLTFPLIWYFADLHWAFFLPFVVVCSRFLRQLVG